MEKTIKPIFWLAIMPLVLLACESEEVIFSAEVQNAQDDQIVADFVADHDLDFARHPEGFFYKVMEQGDQEAVQDKCSLELRLTTYTLDSTFIFSHYPEIEAQFGFSDFQESGSAYVCETYTTRPFFAPFLPALIGVGGKVNMVLPSYLAWGTEGLEWTIYAYYPRIVRSVIIPPNTNLLVSVEMINAE